MLARISGVLDRIESNTALIAMPGAAPGVELAYEVLVPAYLAELLGSQVGALITLHTIQYHEQQAQGASFIPRLIGFASHDDRRFFSIFTTVKGVGNKRALRALTRPINEVARAITLRDSVALQKLPEIGKKLAETMILELQEKVTAFAAVGAATGGAAANLEGKPGAFSGALSEAARRAAAALVRLGETESSAETMLRRAMESDPALQTADELVAAALSAR